MKTESRKKAKSTKRKLAEIRQAVADYMTTEGCSCCRDNEGHKVNAERLAKLLNVKAYMDNSGYNFSIYRSNNTTRSTIVL